jgi:hypothetical protein
MKRLCFLSPDTTHAEAVVRDLRDFGIEERHISVLARSGTPLNGLPDAGPESDDFFPAFERGVALGGAAGLFLGLVAVAFRVSGLVVGGGAVLLIGLMGASLGGLLTGMAGAAFPNSRLRTFAAALEEGKILDTVDVPKDHVSQVNCLIERVHPEVEVEGFEPPAPLIPR